VTEEDLKSKQLKFEKKKKLKLITFNVMMDCWGNNKKETYNHTDMIYTHERRKAIFSTLGKIPFIFFRQPLTKISKTDKMNPHIMALQEITIDMHAALLELPWYLYIKSSSTISSSFLISNFMTGCESATLYRIWMHPIFNLWGYCYYLDSHWIG